MIQVVNVTKRFREATVLSAVNAKFEKGKITGIVGRNGSGKTVLLKCIIGLFHPEEGYVTVDGRRIGKDTDFARNAGFIVDAPGFLPDMSGIQNLMYLASIQGKADRARVEAEMARVGLDPKNRKWVGKYSMGMKQRLGIAQALMEDADLLIFDEPMNGLDNDGVRQMRALFAALRKEGKTLIITSHNSADISSLCDTAYYMDKGVLNGPYDDVDELLEEYAR